MSVAMKNCDPEVRKAAVAAAMKIDGWLSGDEAAVLFDAAYEANGPIVEIGSWQGRSTTVLALGSMAGTGFSGYTFTSQLTGLGKLQCKFVFTQRGEDGTSHVSTCPAVVKSCRPATIDGVAGLLVTYMLVGSVTVA